MTYSLEEAKKARENGLKLLRILNSDPEVQKMSLSTYEKFKAFEYLARTLGKRYDD